MKKILTPVMTPAAFARWATSMQLSQAAIELIQGIRNSPPSRRTQGRHNVRGHWCSWKMGRTIQFESVTGELTQGVELDYNPEVIEFWDQAGRVKICYRDRNGRKIVYYSTPDFFVIGRTYAWWVECKPEEELLKLSQTKPNLYLRQPDGTWRCPPGEEYAARFGLGYKIRSSRESEGELVRNLLFLADYFHTDCPAPSEKLVAAVREKVGGNQGITYPEVLRAVQGLTADHLNYLIARGCVYTDLRKVLLVDRPGVTLYSNPALAAAVAAVSETSGAPATAGTGPIQLVPSARVLVQGTEYMILGVDELAIHLVAVDGKNRHWNRTDFEVLVYTGQVKAIANGNIRHDAALSAIMAAGPEGQRAGLERWELIQPYLGSEQTKKRLPWRKSRNIRRLLARFRAAKLTVGSGFVGLLPKVRPGNTTSCLDPKVIEIMDRSIEQHYEQSTGISIKEAYARFCRECGNLPPPCEKTYRTYIRARPQYQQLRKRKGPRASYQRKPFYWILDIKTPVHGDRPWQIVHIDHTELDIELICSKTGKNLGRPWMSLMMDAFTRRILAIALSFSSESSESNMRLLRECVRRHHRFPQFLVVDQGKGFNSIYFDCVLAAYEISKKSRPAAHPRHGSVCERLFGTTNTQFIHNCRGNSKIMKNVREVTASVNPKNLAIWTLEEFTPFLLKYCYEVYDTTDHPALGMSPREAEARFMEATGLREHKMIAYDSDFQIRTLPTTEHGVARVHPQKGVHINYLDYYAKEFNDPTLDWKEVAIRYDPDDASTAYAFVAGKWAPCVSGYANVFKNWSRRAIEIATEELRKRNRDVARDRNNVRGANGERTSVSARKLADFMKEVATREDMLLLRAREAANRAVTVAVSRTTGALAGRPESAPTKASPPTNVSASSTSALFAAALNDNDQLFPVFED